MTTATLEKVKTIKFTIDKANLQEGLEATAKIVPPKPSHPVLANVVFSIKQNILTLKAYDLSRSLEMRYLIDASDDIEFCISASIKDLISKFNPGEIKIEVNPETYEVTFKQGKSKHKRVGMSADEFPTLPEVTGEKLALIGEKIANAFGRVLFASAQDETKQILQSVNLQAKDNMLKFAATDGHRLAAFSITESCENELNLNIPAKAIQDTIKLVSKASSLNFEANIQLVKLETDSWVYTIRLLEGQYPNYEQLIPAQFERETKVNKSEFLACLDRVLLIADQKNGVVVLDISTESLKVYADVPDYGESEEFVYCQNKGESIFSIAFNGKYLQDAVKAATGDSFTLKTNTATSPGLITGEDTGRFLVMPVQIRG